MSRKKRVPAPTVTIIEAKRGFRHREAFAHSFLELGFKTKTYYIPRYEYYMKERIRETTEWGNIAVFMGARNSVDFYEAIPDSVYKINYQHEQFKQWEKHNTHQRSAGYDLVLDSYNIHTKMRNAENVVFFPGGYSPIYNTTQKDLDLFDFYFVGGGTERRKEKIEDIKKELCGYRVEVDLGTCWGQKRDLKIKSSKINVYIKARSEQYFSPNHMLMVVCKQKFYLHEKCDGSYGPYQPNRHFIEFEGLDDFMEKFEYWISHDKEREAFAKNAHEDIKENYLMTKHLSKILKGRI